MTQNHKYSLRGLALAFIVAAQVGLVPDNAKADSRFQKWIADFTKQPLRVASVRQLIKRPFPG